MARLVLVGLPGAGKSSVGRALGERWACAAIDTDEVLGAGRADGAGGLLREVGEAEFRRREVEVLAESLEHDAVVATGGGAVSTAEGRRLLAGQPVVWLDGPDDVLLPRLGDGDRPLLGADPAGALADLRARRAALYAEVARWRVDAAGTPAQVADRVASVVTP